MPITYGDRAIGVLDIDSPILGRFDAMDGEGMERIVAVFQGVTHFGKYTRVPLDVETG